ncbi:MAG: IS66 family insertion sequence element accessory protein TnpB [Deltaproteobacteria bacterium]|nr:IS66 family insertion sequence element accessory protein TnpB [Deltaproteobacteria bacterium]
MRKAINGLSVLVDQGMHRNPLSGDLFVFCNRRKDIIKILYWDENGFALWQKRLEEHRFFWPQSSGEVLSIGSRQLEWLLSGLDYRLAHQRLNYSRIS